MTKEGKNILLLGRTGSGKSTLGNLLINRDGNYKEVFKESSKSVSETKNYRVESFDLDGNVYNVIDTIGIGDTSLTEEQTLYKLGEIAQEIKDTGVNQILFVTNGRFTKEVIDALKLLGLVIFDKNMHNYTTIVRTGFENFMNQDEVDEDIRAMKASNAELKAVIESVDGRIIHINCPMRTMLSNPAIKEIWDNSRQKVVMFLGKIKEKKYLPENLSNLNERIKKHFEENEKKEGSEKKSDKEVMKDALEEHEQSIYSDLRENYWKSINQGMEAGDKLPLPFGTGRIVGGVFSAIVSSVGGLAGLLAYTLRGKK